MRTDPDTAVSTERQLPLPEESMGEECPSSKLALYSGQ